MPLLLSVLLLMTASVSPARGDMDEDVLRRVRLIYLEAVEHPAAVERGLEEIRGARKLSGPDDDELNSTLLAYEGALLTLRAKHGVWPTRRLQHLQEGLAVLDHVVRSDPENPEVRYLRLMSCYYLPGILGRRQTVREDFAALASLLPAARSKYPSDLFGAIGHFVLENGQLPPEQNRRLRRSLQPDA